MCARSCPQNLVLTFLLFFLIVCNYFCKQENIITKKCKNKCLVLFSTSNLWFRFSCKSAASPATPTSLTATTNERNLTLAISHTSHTSATYQRNITMASSTNGTTTATPPSSSTCNWIEIPLLLTGILLKRNPSSSPRPRELLVVEESLEA